MSTTTQQLACYSINIQGPKEHIEQITRDILCGLFFAMAHAVKEHQKFPLHECKKLVLEIEREHWDQHFVLRLVRDQEKQGGVSTDNGH